MMNIERFKHEHHFNQHKPKAGEQRTFWVIIITAITMAGEILAGLIFGSMALLADGLHMASHATALTISAMAYVYARKHAHDERFSFGTGKVGSLAGFASAVVLAMFALVMVVESINRFFNPVSIVFNEAIFVAILGLVVNVVSVFILNVRHHEHNHAHHHDHNLRAAYLHVLADALTSVLAIIALLAGKFYGLNWMDPMMGIVGAVMVTRWSIGLINETNQVLLDHQVPEPILNKITQIIEGDGESKIIDLHVWSIGSNQYVLAAEILTSGDNGSDDYKQRIQSITAIQHSTIEVKKINQAKFKQS